MWKDDMMRKTAASTKYWWLISNKEMCRMLMWERERESKSIKSYLYRINRVSSNQHETHRLWEERKNTNRAATKKMQRTSHVNEYREVFDRKELSTIRNWFECLYLFTHLTFDIIHYLWWLLFGVRISCARSQISLTNKRLECVELKLCGKIAGKKHSKQSHIYTQWSDYGKWLFVLISNSLFIYQQHFFPPCRHVVAIFFHCYLHSCAINVEHILLKYFPSTMKHKIFDDRNKQMTKITACTLIHQSIFCSYTLFDLYDSLHRCGKMFGM